MEVHEEGMGVEEEFVHAEIFVSIFRKCKKQLMSP